MILQSPPNIPRDEISLSSRTFGYPRRYCPGLTVGCKQTTEAGSINFRQELANQAKHIRIRSSTQRGLPISYFRTEQFRKGEYEPTSA